MNLVLSFRFFLTEVAELSLGFDLLAYVVFLHVLLVCVAVTVHVVHL